MFGVCPYNYIRARALGSFICLATRDEARSYITDLTGPGRRGLGINGENLFPCIIQLHFI